MNDELKLARILEQYVDDLNNSPQPALTKASDPELQELAPLIELAAGFKFMGVEMPAETTESVMQQLQEQHSLKQLNYAATSQLPAQQIPARRKTRRLVVTGLGIAAALALAFVVLSLVLLLANGNKVENSTGSAPTIRPITTVVQPTRPVTGTVVNILQGHSTSVRTLAWSPDGKFLASGSEDETVLLWTTDFKITIGSTSLPKPNDDRKPAVTINNTPYGIAGLRWSPDSKTFSAGFNQLWDTQGKAQTALPEGFYGWSPDGKLQIYHKDNVIELRHPDGKVSSTISIPEGSLGLVAWSPDGKVIATGGQNVAQAGPSNIRLWFWTVDGKNIATISTFGRPFTSLAWSPDSKILASSTKGEPAQLWTAEGKPIKTLESNNSLIWSLAWSPDGKLLAGGCDDGKLRLWNPDGKLVATLNEESTKTIWSVAWSPDSQQVAIGSDDATIRIWEITK